MAPAAETDPVYGPNQQQLGAWRTNYLANQAAVNTVLGRRKSPAGIAAGAIYGSPIVFGTTGEFYDFNLDYYKVVRNEKFDISNAFPSFLADYADGYTDAPSPYFYTSGVREGDGFYKDRERNVKSHTFAGQAGQLTIKSDYRKSNLPKRSSTSDLASQVLTGVVKQVQGTGSDQGLFSAIIPGAPNGFLVSEAHDFDVQYSGDPDVEEKSRLLSTYWPPRLGNIHPLRDLYDKFYGSGPRLWSSGRDRAGTTLLPGSSLLDNNPLTNSSRKVYDYSRKNDPVVLVTGPFSQTDLKFGNGNNIIVSSPAMTLALHRTIRSRIEYNFASPHTVDDYHADTVLYPSSVGQYGTNNLDLGNGNNVIYYDSSIGNVNSGSGNNIFIPSFGSFNWSINWVPAYATQLTNGYNDSPSPWGSTQRLNQNWLLNTEAGTPLISPIPWDLKVFNPFDGKPAAKSYLSDNAKFALAPKSGEIANLYTINTYLRTPLQNTYFNSERLNDGASEKDPSKKLELQLKSYNPVSQLGGVTIKANGGNNTFYGMDWSFWKHLLPTDAGVLTTANQQVDNTKKITRAAQHLWNTTTFAGGRGSNTFNLGNVIDNITNNSLFYSGDASYRLSLTHDNIYAKNDIFRSGLKFGNAFDEITGSPLMSVVNLQLNADPSTLSVTIQDADPGQAGTTKAQQAGAWSGLANAANKFVSNGAKIQEDLTKNWMAKVDGKPRPSWLATSKSLARIVGTAVPFFDTAISVVSAVVGLVNLFSAKPAKPPKEEIKVTYLTQALDPALKAVVINDWNPAAKININLPSVDSSQWSALTFEIKDPAADSSRNTGKGVYLNVNKNSVDDKGNSAKTDFPLVVLEHLGAKDKSFGYYSYSFVDPDGDGPLRAGAFNYITGDNLRLFGSLPDPSKLLADDGKMPLNQIIFPSAFRDGAPFVYRSDNGFDMRYDAANYSSLFQGQEVSKQPFYSRYYFNANTILPSDMPSDWSLNRNLRQFTSNVSLEFDSRTLGWYWQPVLQVSGQSTDGLGPDQQSIDLDRSRLWIRDSKTGDWNYTSYADLGYLSQAYANSLKATTFYFSSFNGEGSADVARRQDRIAQFELLQTVVPDLRLLDQGLIRDERSRLYVLAQVKSVRSVTGLPAEGGRYDGLIVTFTSVDEKDNEVVKELFIYQKGGLAKAADVDDSKRLLAENLARLLAIPGFEAQLIAERRQYTNDYRGGRDSFAYPVGLELTSVDQLTEVRFNGNPSLPESTVELTYQVSGQLYRATAAQKRRVQKLGFPEDRNLYWVASYQGPVAPKAVATNALAQPANLRLEAIPISSQLLAMDSKPSTSLPWLDQPLLSDQSAVIPALV
jgi:hypothetical protein